VCAHFGAPLKVTQGSDGRVNWRYGSVVVTFKGNHIVKEIRAGGNSTYSITESLVRVGSSAR
jgi:hypothetical protein